MYFCFDKNKFDSGETINITWDYQDMYPHDSPFDILLSEAKSIDEEISYEECISNTNLT